MMGVADSLLPLEGVSVINGYPYPDGFQIYRNTPRETVTSGFDYRKRLIENKAKLGAAMQAAGLSADRKLLFLAMAMRETATLSPCERDWTKDVPDTPSTNVSIFNANKDFIGQLSMTRDYATLNSIEGLIAMVRIMNLGITKFGLLGMLNYHRGGSTAFKDPKALFAPEYRSSIKTTIAALERDAKLQSDDRKIWIDVKYVDDSMIKKK